MYQKRQLDARIELRCPGVVRPCSCGARHAFDHRIDGLEMTWVGHQRHEHLAARARCPRARVILHVAAPAEIEPYRLAQILVLEFRQNLLVRLVKHVGEHVQPTPVRHPEHRVSHSLIAGSADDLVEHRHQHVETLEREARSAGKYAVQKLLENLDLREPLEQRFSTLRIHDGQKPS